MVGWFEFRLAVKVLLRLHVSMNFGGRIFIGCVIAGAVGGVIKCGWEDGSSKRSKDWKDYLAHVLWGMFIGAMASNIVAGIALPTEVVY